MTVPNRISIITLGVADLAASTAFYESLGWTKSKASMPTITFFDMQGSVFGLYEWWRSPTTPRCLPTARVSAVSPSR